MTASTKTTYVPPLELTAGQPAPIAANGGLSYMSFDQDGDAGTRRAISDALALIEGVMRVPPLLIWMMHLQALSKLSGVRGFGVSVNAWPTLRRAACRRRKGALLYRFAIR